MYWVSDFCRGSEGTILRSGQQDRRRSSPEKEERYYTTRGVVDNIGKLCLDGNNGEDSNNKEEESMWPKLFITLSSKEKEEDFMAMKGCKPSHRPKKRAKLIQRSLLVSFKAQYFLFCLFESVFEDSSIVYLQFLIK